MDFEINLFWACVFLPAGLLILIKGADLLVDGAVALAEKFGVSPLIVGLTVVAMGTSAPEVATSITAAAQSLGDTAIGNVYGSNIANLALVGGLCALIRPISVKLSMIRRELPIMLIVALLLWPVLAIDSYLSRGESLILLLIFAGLISFTVVTGRRDAKANPAGTEEIDKQIHDRTKPGSKSFTACFIYIILGLTALVIGAKLTIWGGVFIGKMAGLSEAVIGLTIIAVGTSLPELVTCVVAALKGHDDISIGNLVGSNVFNTLLVVGSAGLIRPFSVNARLIGPDFWVMIAVSAVFVAIAVIAKRISRSAGILLTAIYVAYMIYVLALTRGV